MGSSKLPIVNPRVATERRKCSARAARNPTSSSLSLKIKRHSFLSLSAPKSQGTCNRPNLGQKSDISPIDGILSKCQNSDCEYDKDGCSVVYNQGTGSDSGVAAPTVPHRGWDKGRGAGDARWNSLKTDDSCQHSAIARPDKAEARRRTV